MAKPKSKTRWYVIDDANFASWDERVDEPESFVSQTVALKRAHELASERPNEEFRVCESTILVKCPVGSPTEEQL